LPGAAPRSPRKGRGWGRQLRRGAIFSTALDRNGMQ